MQNARWVIWLTGVNFVLLIVTLARPTPTVVAEGVTPVVRTGSLQIVDAQGRVRASLGVLPAGTSAHGDRSPETVLLRLITEQGRPSVKISASEEASGVSVAGPSNTKDTYLILEVKGTASSLTLRDESGRRQVVRPEHDVERTPTPKR